MNKQSNAAGRAAKNTVVLYLQRFFAAGLSLITTPIILSALGVEDYGLYTLIIGFVGMLTFLNWSLSSATQRYIAVAIGQKDEKRIQNVFVTSLFIHLCYGLLFLLAILVLGNFFSEAILNIPDNKVATAKTLFTIVAGITFFTILSIPFLGVLRAHENFFLIAVTGITESISKLGIALLLLLATQDKLLFYAELLLVLSLLVFLIYAVSVKRKYTHLSFAIFKPDGALIKEMLTFISWSFLGALAIMSRNQGVQVLINLFFGVAKNAAYGIAMQVSAAMSILSQGIISSISPQILKSAGAGNQERMLFLMRTMSKFAVFSVSLVVIPLFFECQTILNLWLPIVPEDTITFIRWIMIFGQVMLLSAGIQTVFDALGKVKEYHTWVSLILLLNLPIGYLFFYLDFPAYTIIIIGMLLELCSLQVRLILLQKHVAFSIVAFYKDAVIKTLFPTVVLAIVLFFYGYLPVHSYTKVVLSFGTTLVFYPILIYKFALDSKQKELLVGLLDKIKIPLLRKS